jgi:magnesium-transporting ATPase (P-type)
MNFILEIAFKGEVPEDRHTKTSIVIIALLFVPANILFIWGLIFDALFQRLLLFLGMIYISTLLFLWGRAKRQALPFLQSRFFRERLDESKRRLEELVFICIALVPGILTLVSLYSRQLYCRLPSNYGGAKPLYATIYVVDTKPMHVQIIDDTQSNLFVKLEKENKVFLINKSLINKVEIALK